MLPLLYKVIAKIRCNKEAAATRNYAGDKLAENEERQREFAHAMDFLAQDWREIERPITKHFDGVGVSRRPVASGESASKSLHGEEGILDTGSALVGFGLKPGWSADGNKWIEIPPSGQPPCHAVPLKVTGQ